MNPRMRLACLAGDAAHWTVTRLLRRGGGNIPGVVAMRLYPGVISSLAEGLGSSVVVTGTNGKTTTTGLIADALGAAGHNVVCNRAGNNMETGIAAAMVLGRSGHGERGSGSGMGIRTGCFECDELYTVRILPQLRPHAFVLLNLFRDQLDRYGEIDRTQDAIAAALASSPQTTLVYNADDPLCAAIADRLDNPKAPFGIDEPTSLEQDRISDSRFCARCNTPLDYEYVHYGQLGSYRCPSCGWERARLAFAVRNVTLGEGGYEFDVVDQRWSAHVTHHLSCRYSGLYMVYNIAAALAATLVMGADTEPFQGVLDSYQAVSGRGKTFDFGPVAAETNLAKNPTGFDRMIDQVCAENGRFLAFYLNDAEADGRDISWIWDVDFERLAKIEGGRAVFVGGTRAEDLAVRLKYAELGIPVKIARSEKDVLEECAALGAQDGDGPVKLHAVANYTAFPLVVSSLEKLKAAGWTASAKAGAAAGAAGAGRGGAAAEPGFSLERPLRVVHLYPDALNLYGDGGNIASLEKRCSWRKIPVRVDRVLMGGELDLSDADVVLLGGGSDRDQLAVCKELLAQREKLAAYVADGGVLLAICGGYQLLGEFYEMGPKHERVEGLGILDVQTRAGQTRLIGNRAISSALCGEPVVGFENHAGRTVLGPGEKPLGSVLVAGSGNNGEDGGEGVLHKNVVGTYLHGPVLPKNPCLTDWLITQALRRRGVDAALAPLDDSAEKAAHDVALKLAERER